MNKKQMWGQGEGSGEGVKKQLYRNKWSVDFCK